MLLQQQQQHHPNVTSNHGNGGGSDPVQATIWHCLNNYAYEDAIFLAERLMAMPIVAEDSETSSPTRLHLLATAYYRSGDKLQCFELLRNHHKSVSSLSYKCRLLLATVAWELDKPTLAESTLLATKNNNSSHGNPLETIEKNYHESTCFALKLYGKICTATERLSVAREAYSRALRLNPFLFNAFECLVKLGANNNKENFGGVVGGRELVDRVFQTTHLPDSSLLLNCHGILPEETIKPVAMENNNKTGILMNRNNTRNNNTTNNNSRCHRNLFTSTPNSHFFGLLTPPPNNNATPPPLLLTATPPTTNPTPTDTTTTSIISPIITMENNPTTTTTMEPKPKKPCLRTVSSPQQQSNISSSSWQQQQQQQQSQNQQQQQTVRRSSRLFGGGGGGGGSSGQSDSSSNNKQQCLKENTKEQQQQQSVVSQPAARKQQELKFRKSSKIVAELDRGVLDTLLTTTIRDLALATYHLTRYDCRKAIDTIASLKPGQASTSYALATLARAQFELGDYEGAVGTFTLLRQTHPFHASLPYLSSSLWHLSSETALSTLSQEYLSHPINKSLSSTWLTLGNTFSLQKEHETAIKFFKRAIQIDHNKYYAHILLGHEYVSTDELDKALRCFRTASRIDSSQYNCWYGIGMIYYKQERFEEALYYYEKAVGVNKGNCVLLCHLGVVQSALNHPEKSLQTFNQALLLNPADPLCKFHRASVLFASGRFDDALVELQELKRIVPKESLVHFLIAKIHSKQGHTHKALLHFSWATDLDPKGANNHIKESIEPVLNNNSMQLDAMETAGQEVVGAAAAAGAGAAVEVAEEENL